MVARASTAMLLMALIALTAAPSSALAGRRLLQTAGTYESSGSWGSTKTTVNADGSSTTETDTPYYKGTTSSEGRKLQQAIIPDLPLPAGTYESSGDWGSTVTTVNPDGTSTTKVNTPTYQGTVQGRRLQQAIIPDLPLPAGTYGCSGDWGSTVTTVNPDGTSETQVNTPTYQGTVQGRRLQQTAGTYESSGDWGSTKTVVNADGSTTTETSTPYYQGSTSSGAGGSTTETNTPYYQGTTSSEGRKLQQTAGTYGSSGDWGSTKTVVNADGSTTTETSTPYYQGSTSSGAGGSTTETNTPYYQGTTTSG